MSLEPQPFCTIKTGWSFQFKLLHSNVSTGRSTFDAASFLLGPQDQPPQVSYWLNTLAWWNKPHVIIQAWHERSTPWRWIHQIRKSLEVKICTLKTITSLRFLAVIKWSGVVRWKWCGGDWATWTKSVTSFR